MAIKFVIHAYEDYGSEKSTEMDWDTQTKIMEKDLSDHIKKYPGGKIEFTLKQTNHGIGLDLPTITIEILTVAGWAFFALPAFHKVLRETIKEWKIMMQEIVRVIHWIRKKKSISVYPKEYAFLTVLEYLEQRTDILNLQPIHAIEILGKADTIHKPSIENAGLIYYLFVLREESEKCFFVLIDSCLNIIFSHIIGLDQRYRQEVKDFTD